MASILTGKLGSAYVIDESTASGAEATTEDGASKIYQIDNADHRILDVNVEVVVSVGVLDTSYYDHGVNRFEGKVKLLTTGEGGLTLAVAWVTLQKVGTLFGWALQLTIDAAEKTELGDDWKGYLALAKSATVTLSRYRADQLLDQKDFSGYQECGLVGKTGVTETGLAGATQYYFKINVDGAGEVEYDITTGGDTTYAGVIALIVTELAAVDCDFALADGDFRCTSYKDGVGSTIALAAGTTGADLFATLTDFVNFETAVAGSVDDLYVLIKLFEDADSGYWVKALRTAFGLTKAINTIDQEALTFVVDGRVAYFVP